jgi:YfiH family protein
LLFTDIKGSVVAVAHAGWKGTLGGISANVISRIADLGINKHDILVSMGPHIGACCYDVPGERAKQFLSFHSNDPGVAFERKGTWYIDLAYSNRLQLQKAGVSSDHIESDAPCTSCNPESLYSFRRDTKATFGEIIGVIGFQ